MKERMRSALPGLLMLLFWILLGAFSAYVLAQGIMAKEITATIGAIVMIAVDCLGFAGLFTVQPNQGAVLQLFGRYVGTVRDPGLQWANPFYSKKRISLRVRNFETGKLKVNDHSGNPIEIAAVVVWQVIDTAQAAFQVDEYEHYVHVQSEAALRNLATAYPYDSHEDSQMSLRGNTLEVAEHLKREIQERLDVAGVQVTEARISHLAYAP